METERIPTISSENWMNKKFRGTLIRLERTRMFCRYLLEPMMDFKRTVGISSSDSLLGGSGGIESEWTETVWFHLLELGHVGIIPVTKSLMIHHVVLYIYIYVHRSDAVCSFFVWLICRRKKFTSVRISRKKTGTRN